MHSSPRVPPYRITLFYGPEYVAGTPKVVQCVFNVKKRSWKGGVQIVVDLGETQFKRVWKSLQFDEWLEGVLDQIPKEYHAECEGRAKDLLAQQVCFVKLQQAIQQGIQQENMTLENGMLVKELDDATIREADHIKSQVLTELDIQEMVAQEYS